MTGDLEEAVRMLAADNARMCDILIKADALAKAADYAVKDYHNMHTTDLELALDAYKVVRQGQ